jgi:hypothetical protein
MVFQDSYKGDWTAGTGRAYALQDASWNVTSCVTLVTGNWAVSQPQRFQYKPYGELETVPQPGGMSWHYFYHGGYLTIGADIYSFRNTIYIVPAQQWLQDGSGDAGGGYDLDNDPLIAPI